MSLRFGSIGGYAIAFSLTGLILYALQLLPNIIWLVMPPANDVLKHNRSAHAFFNLVEQVFGIATVALLIIVITGARTESRNSSWVLVCAAVFLVGYYAAWAFLSSHEVGRVSKCASISIFTTALARFDEEFA